MVNLATEQDVIHVMEDRGYTLWATSFFPESDIPKVHYDFVTEEHNGNHCTVYVVGEEITFEFVYATKKMVVLRLGPCGSFFNRDHFVRMERNFNIAADKVRDLD